MSNETGLTRRAIIAAGLGAAAATVIGGSSRPAWAQSSASFTYPMALPGRLFGDGFVMRHGFTVENTWYLPGFWHAGEDWYLIEGDTAGVGVFAIGDGEVVYTGGNYPGLVVILRHADDLYSMYGHLAFDAPVSPGDDLRRGDAIGTVLRRDDAIPNHLHVEVRSFLQTAVVNGDAPLYGFGCGPDCPPGPGYWPIDAPDLPAGIGWLNPTHAIANRWGAAPGSRSVVVPAAPGTSETPVWSAPADVDGAEEVGVLPLEPGTRYPVLRVDAGDDAPSGTSAEAYRLWYEIELPESGTGWVRGVVADDFETGSDGRPSTVRFNLLPDFVAPG